MKQLTKTAIETALSEEMTEHLDYEKHDPAGAGTGYVRNGTRAKTVLTEASGHVEIDVSCDRAGPFELPIVRKRQRRLNGVDEIVLSLYAKGLTTGKSARTSLRSTAQQSARRRSAGSPTGFWRRCRSGFRDPSSRPTRRSLST